MIVLPKVKLFGISCVITALVLGAWVDSSMQSASAQEGRRGGFGRRMRGGDMPQPIIIQQSAPSAEPKKEEPKPDAKPAEDPNKKGGPVEAVKRPDKPKKEANKDELTLKPDKDGKIKFNFRGQQWTDVLEWYAGIANVSLDWQEVPGKTVDLVTQQSYTLDESRDILNKLLFDRGYTLVRNGEVLSVVNLANLDTGILPRVEPDQLKSRDAHEFVKVSFPLDTLLSENAAEEFKGMKSKFGTLTPLKATNRLEVVDAVVNLRELYALITQEQSAKGQERLVVPFELQYTRAADVKDKLEALLGSEKKAGPSGPMSPEQMQQMQMQAMQRAQQPGQKLPGADDKKQVYIVANERDNSLLVSGPADKIAVVRQAVTLLDQPKAKSGYADTLQDMRVYRLSGLDPEALVKTLQARGNLDPRTSLEVDKTNNALIAFAPLLDHGKIKMMVDTLDGSGRKPKVIKLRRLPADYVAGTLTVMVNGDEEESKGSRRRSYGYYGGYYGGYGSQQPQKNDKFRATADVEHNKLLLWANEVELKLVDDFLVELGEISPKQGNNSTIRSLEIAPGEQTELLLERLKQAWPQFAPNELKIDIAPEKKEKTGKEGEPGDAKPERDLRTEQKPNAKPEAQGKDEDTVAAAPRSRDRIQPFLKLAELQTDNDAAPAGETKPTDGESQTKDDTAAPEQKDSKPAAEAPAVENRKEGESQTAPSQPSDSAPEKAQPEPRRRRHPIADSENEEQPSRPQLDKNGKPPAITITRSPRGGLVIHSDDPRALDLLEELIGELAPPQEDFVLYHLKHADAYYTALNLTAYFKEDDKKKTNDFDSWYFGFSQDNKEETPNSLSKRKPLKFIDDFDTNTLIVQGGTASQLETVKKLIAIWDKPEPKDTQSARKLETFHIKYSKAKVVAETIKEVYRDLLSENDKALQENSKGDKEKKPSADRIYTYIDAGGGDEKKNPVRFKGLLSVGIDELSNTLLVSAPPWLLIDVTKMITELDAAAMPSSKVQVLQVDRRINSAVLQKKLAEVFGKRGTPGKGQQQPNGQPGENANNGENNGQQDGGARPGRQVNAK